MKKLTKLCLLIAAVFGVFGVALCLIGFILGGGSGMLSAFKEAFRNNSFGLFASSGAYEVSGDEEASEYYSDIPYKFMADDVDALKLEMDFGSINLCESENSDQIEINFYGGNQTCELEGGTLEIKMENNYSGASAEIYIPAGKRFEKIEIDGDAGDLYADTLKSSGKIDISADTGEINVYDLEAEELILSCDAGNIFIDESDVKKNAQIEAELGNITYNPVGEESDYNYEISADLGTVFIDSQQLNGLSHKRTVDNGMSRTMKISADMGEIDVYFTGGELTASEEAAD